MTLQVPGKGCDVLSNVDNAIVGHSDNNLVFDNRHKHTLLFYKLTVNVKISVAKAIFQGYYQLTKKNHQMIVMT
jgi:hypothetical protein